MRLVLFHALPLDGTMWARQTAFPVDATIAPTLYRFGDALEEWAAGVLDVVGHGPFVVVGNSVGGSCAIEVARLAPERVAAVVLVGAKPGVRPEPTARDEAVRVLTTGGMAAAWPRYWAPLFGRDAEPHAVEAARRIAFAQNVDDVIRGVRAFHNRADRAEFVEQWTKPLVVVSGDQDRTPSPAVAAAFAMRAPAGAAHTVESCGHYVSFERPHALDAIVRHTLDAVGGRER